MSANSYIGVDDGVWETGANWTRGVPAVDDDLTFDATTPTGPTAAASVLTITFSALSAATGANFDNLTITGTGPTVTSITITNRGFAGLALADWTGGIEAPAAFGIVTPNRRVTIPDPNYPAAEHVFLGTTFGPPLDPIDGTGARGGPLVSSGLVITSD
jgi:hypothetical protein